MDHLAHRYVFAGIYLINNCPDSKAPRERMVNTINSGLKRGEIVNTSSITMKQQTCQSVK